jgi:endonuclease/exonuclease/phosphatase family metal-dependent hydrolase
MNWARRDRGLHIWLGDFNEWMPRGPIARRLGRYFAGAWLASFPTRRPLLALDRIWVAPSGTATAWSVDRSLLARAASDHLPVRADVTLRPTGPGGDAVAVQSRAPARGRIDHAGAR